MTREQWDALVDQARARDMVHVARAHGAKLAKQGRTGEFVGACPVCGSGRDRFAIKPKKGFFNCRVCGRGGHGPIDLEMFLGGGDFVAAVKRLTNTTSLSGLTTATDPEAATAHDRERERDEAEQHEVAHWLWSKRQPIAGSPVERYLRARGFAGSIPPTLGYLPPHGKHGPAMIAAYAMPVEREPGELGAPVIDPATAAVHLTRLLPDGSDRVREYGAKISIGRTLGRPIVVSSITDGLSLVITEGIEDALAYHVAGYAAWAAGSAPYFPALAEHIPDYVTTIIIEQHPDPDGKAQRYITRLIELLHERGVRPCERPVDIIIREATP
jgi:hypothetical protein